MVVDTGSTDDTKDIASSFGARILDSPGLTTFLKLETLPYTGIIQEQLVSDLKRSLV
ncbi:hypothetical protein ACPUYX_01895 [Desulfosporosinus sp. SYSU MS00001]|uniref:hypothetical protein n=1 Tax=Desulfosporosinus sp. SYSU MS00001 TaxID=3416284 RepID=UPI003CF3242C